MRLRLVFALVCSAPASWAGGRIGLEVESSAGLNWALTDQCRYTSCPSPLGLSIRAGYQFVPFASVGVRAEAILGPEGQATCGGGVNCSFAAGYRARSLLLDGSVHTLGATQLVGGFAVGVGRLVRLQCDCSEQYDTHGSGLPVLEIALGVRTYVVPRILHIGIEGRYSAMFNAESAGSTALGPPVMQTGLTVSSIGASLVVGASL
jgi:hypothetical protein